MDDDGNEEFAELKNMCYRPIPEEGCLVSSPLNYFQSDRVKLNTVGDPVDYIDSCLSAPLSVDCMTAIGSPVLPTVVFGGVPGNNYTGSTAMILTVLLDSTDETLTQAYAWENAFLEIAGANYTLVDVAYSAQRSVQDEISREGKADIPIVVLSYLLMFLYVSLALGDWYPFPKPWYTFIVHSRFFLGLSGVVIVLCSIAIAVGFLSICQVEATLIISEVIPFLVLAIGVDNIFIMLDTFEKTDLTLSVEERMGLTMAEIGSSITVASISESVAFLLGFITKMPAVQAFALYAGVAVFFDFVLQATCFIALLSLDTKRRQKRRVDCFPCYQIPSPPKSETSEEAVPLMEPIDPKEAALRDIARRKKPEGILQIIARKYYGPFLLHPIVKFFVVVTFVGALCLAIDQSSHIVLGLDQRVVLPSDSYLQTYYNELYAYSVAGAPFWVTVGTLNYDYSQYDNQQGLCSLSSCDFDSVVNQFDAAPYVAGTGYSWMDDYFLWAAHDTCCWYYVDDPETLCEYTVASNEANPGLCAPCFPEFTDAGRPLKTDFYNFLPGFLNYNISGTNIATCPMTGYAYLDNVEFNQNVTVEGGFGHPVETSRFTFYHTVLSTQKDYINAVRTVYDLSDAVSEQFGVEIFAYSNWYVFFEQYLTIGFTVGLTVGLALGTKRSPPILSCAPRAHFRCPLLHDSDLAQLVCLL